MPERYSPPLEGTRLLFAVMVFILLARVIGIPAEIATAMMACTASPALSIIAEVLRSPRRFWRRSAARRLLHEAILVAQAWILGWVIYIVWYGERASVIFFTVGFILTVAVFYTTKLATLVLDAAGISPDDPISLIASAVIGALAALPLALFLPA